MSVVLCIMTNFTYHIKHILQFDTPAQFLEDTLKGLTPSARKSNIALL